MATSMGMGTQQTGTANEVYDMVSVLYHALKGAQTYGEYSKDAQQSGNSELAQFFQQCQQEDIRRADRAKQMMSKYMH
jgi:hypothetical protein